MNAPPVTTEKPEQISSRPYRICTKLIMDTTDPDIEFDADGVCNHWHEYQKGMAEQPQGEEQERALLQSIADIKAKGAGKKYDCLVGLSGGVDSSYLAYLARKFELRPLIVHFDNGWNHELAVHNIEQIVNKLDYDLHTFVMDWEEFRDLQRAYFKASVLDLEVPTDHMIFGALYKIASEHGIVSIISGNNFKTESLLPTSWYYPKFDLVNLRNIHRKYGERKLKKLPALGLWQAAYYQLVRGVRAINMLDLLPYNKLDAKKLLIEEFGWRDYGGKHYEQIFTRFYQGYILPRKFNIDKRKAHLSNLICSGEMTREEAMKEMEKPTYPLELQQQDKTYVAKKLGFTDEEFEGLLTQSNRDHSEFGNDSGQREFFFACMRMAKPVTRIIKKILNR